MATTSTVNRTEISLNRPEEPQDSKKSSCPIPPEVVIEDEGEDGEDEDEDERPSGEISDDQIDCNRNEGELDVTASLDALIKRYNPDPTRSRAFFHRK